MEKPSKKYRDGDRWKRRWTIRGPEPPTKTKDLFSLNEKYNVSITKAPTREEIEEARKEQQKAKQGKTRLKIKSAT